MNKCAKILYMNKTTQSPTVWQKWQCGGGARWTSVIGSPFNENLTGTICNFSGCNCGTKITDAGHANREEAGKWFRRPSKRIKALLPNGVPKYVRCYDNGGKTADRYTVVFTGNYRRGNPQKEWFQYLSMSAAPYHPQGIGQHGESERQIDVNKSGFAPMIGRSNHLGKRIPFVDLPEDCRRLVLSDYRSIWSLK